MVEVVHDVLESFVLASNQILNCTKNINNNVLLGRKGEGEERRGREVPGHLDVLERNIYKIVDDSIDAM